MTGTDSNELEELFPNLREGEYQITSPAVSQYNCLAWAVGSAHHWWQAVHVNGYYWPPNIPFNDSLKAWIGIFELHGFHVCEDAAFEPEWEKIAIYIDESNEPQHVARQLESGEWTSKLGELQDIRHKNLVALESESYGRAKFFLKKHRVDWRKK